VSFFSFFSVRKTQSSPLLKKLSQFFKRAIQVFDEKEVKDMIFSLD